MDADVVRVPADGRGKLTGPALAATLDSLAAADRDRLFAVVATAGTTNAGVVDDLRAAAEAADSAGTWMHVDGAYGGAGLIAPSIRHLYDGVEHADSFIVDPHKWLFAPYDSCALVYRDPEIARLAHTQHAEYLDVHPRRRRPRRRVEPRRLRPPPHPTRPGPAVLVQPGDLRHDRLRRLGRDDARRHPCRGRPGARRAAPRTGGRAGAVGRAVPPPRLGCRRLPAVERRPAAAAAVVRHAVRRGATRRCCGGAS